MTSSAAVSTELQDGAAMYCNAHDSLAYVGGQPLMRLIDSLGPVAIVTSSTGSTSPHAASPTACDNECTNADHSVATTGTQQVTSSSTGSSDVAIALEEDQVCANKNSQAIAAAEEPVLPV